MTDSVYQLTVRLRAIFADMVAGRYASASMKRVLQIYIDELDQQLAEHREDSEDGQTTP